MKLTWLGHSCFRVESNGSTVILDPYCKGTVPGLRDVQETADLVLCSHGHSDHAGAEQVVLTGKDCSITVTRLETYHDDAKGTQRGPNTIHILEAGGVRVAHFGDIGCTLEEDQAEALTGVDVALVPVGGFFTIDAKQAARLVERIRPKVVIPMHYRSDRFGFPVIAPVEDFTSLMEDVKVMNSSVFDTMDGEKASVVILKPALL